MKKVLIFLIIGLSLAVVSTIALPGLGDRASVLWCDVFGSFWKAIKAGTAMEPGTALPEEPTKPNQG
jgi:hypothetical protein